MKTPEYYLDEVAKERGHDNATSYFMSHFAKSNMSLVKEAMLRHSKEAYEELMDEMKQILKTCDTTDLDSAEQMRASIKWITQTCALSTHEFSKNAKSPIE